MSDIKLGARTLGSDYPCFVIAELSANHNHDLARALDSIDAAAESGADAIKLQTYTADTITFKSDAAPFQVSGGTAWDGRTLYDLYDEAHTPWEWHAELFERATSHGIEYLSSPFDPTAVDFLDELDVAAFKVASMEIVDLPLIANMAGRGKPVIVSTGIATVDEIDRAVATCRAAGNDDIVLLQCTSGYPTPLDQLNLRTIPDLRERFGTLVGLSDHTMTHTAVAAATALGACVVEKHFTLDRAAGGPDSTFSMEPHEFAEMVCTIRDVETALGVVTYELQPSARSSRRFARSLFVVVDVRAGDTVSDDNVRSIRPHDGLAPDQLPLLLGKQFVADVSAGTPLTRDLVES
jgi:pseudaminic acid synthase